MWIIRLESLELNKKAPLTASARFSVNLLCLAPENVSEVRACIPSQKFLNPVIHGEAALECDDDSPIENYCTVVDDSVTMRVGNVFRAHLSKISSILCFSRKSFLYP